MHALHYSLHRQSGMVLVVSMLILLLLTIIAVSGMKVSGLEEKMAGNDRDQSVAFQAAETALRMAEAQTKAIYEAGNLGTFCDGTVGDGLFYSPNIEDGDCLSCTAGTGAECTIPNPMNPVTWTSNNYSVQVDSTKVLPGSEARYFITYYYYHRNKGSDKTIDSYYFIVTARGAGAQGGEVILRSYFGGKLDMGQT